MKIGNKLNQLRKLSGMTQEQLAEKIDVSRQTISKWESDSTSPDLESIVKLSRIFHVSLDVLSPISRNNTALWRAAARQEIYMEFLKNPPEQGNGQPVTCSTSGMGLRLK